MAGRSVVIQDSPTNFVQFVDAEFAQHPSIHQLYSGQEWEEKTYAPGTFEIPYKYPAEMADRIQLQFHCSYINVQFVNLRLFKVTNRNGRQVALPFYTFPISIQTFVPGNSVTIPGSGIVEPLSTYNYNQTYAQIPNITPGIYYFVITIGYYDDGGIIADKFHSKKSGHIDLQWSHPKTILLSGTNRSNDYDTIFVQTGATPTGRLRGALLDYNPSSEDGSYENQRNRVRKLYSVPEFNKTLVIGGGRGIPQWVKAWANYMMALDYKAVDNIEITKDENSQWDMIAGSPTYPLGGMSMSVREADKTRPYTTVIPTYVVLFTRPTAAQYQVVTVAMRKDAGPVVTLGSGFFIRNSNDESKMLSRLQAEVVRLQLKGYVSFVGNELRYINHYTEGYNISASIALSRFLAIQYAPQYASTFALAITGTYLAIDWGDGSYNTYGGASSAMLNPTHTYSSNAPVTVKVFHGGNTITSLSTAGSVGVSGIGGEVTNTLIDLQIVNSKIVNFDSRVLIPAYASLQLLVIRGGDLQSVTDLDYTLNRTTTPFTTLNDIQMNLSKLPTIYIDEILDAVKEHARLHSVNNGSINLKNQTPLAPPTSKAVGSSYYRLINTYGWTVQTD